MFPGAVVTGIIASRRNRGSDDLFLARRLASVAVLFCRRAFARVLSVLISEPLAARMRSPNCKDASGNLKNGPNFRITYIVILIEADHRRLVPAPPFSNSSGRSVDFTWPT